jgi:flagellar FliL protein
MPASPASPATPAAAPPPAAAAPARPGLLRRLMGLLLRSVGLALAAAVLAGAGFAAGWLYFAQPDSPVLAALQDLKGAAEEEHDPDAPPEPKKVPAPKPVEEKFVTSYYSFPEPLTTNLSGSRRYLMVSVALSTQYDPSVMTNVDTHKAALQSDMLAVIGAFTEEDLQGREGRDRLGAALRDAINMRLEALEGFGGVEGVYFPSFVMQ